MQPTVAHIVVHLEGIAPTALAQSWDNVGLLVGDSRAAVRRILLCIDLTPEVVAEAVSRSVQLVVAYHPPLFKPISRIHADSRATDGLLFECIAHRIGIYALHTALDAAPGGTNDVLAERCGIRHAQPLETVDEPRPKEFKLVVFCPMEVTDRVADSMAGAGAGVIGQYRRCGFRIAGRGTFQGSADTHPVVGQAGVYETMDEIRLEMVVPKSRLAGVIDALHAAHPYEEPAFDIYPLQPRPVPGIGRWGWLPRPMALGTMARKLKKACSANGVQIVGDRDSMVHRAVIVAGSAGSLPFRAGLSAQDVVVTGELRHHDALAILRHGASAIVLGHWTSERIVLSSVAQRLRESLPKVEVHESRADREPFTPL